MLVFLNLPPLRSLTFLLSKLGSFGATPLALNTAGFGGSGPVCRGSPLLFPNLLVGLCPSASLAIFSNLSRYLQRAKGKGQRAKGKGQRAKGKGKGQRAKGNGQT